ncbi:hypothetical protein [Streptomyces wuyuanensis]|uniref:hypothetical protein n=1 Tax=Streptomyces wuyuanensis TaxID=1196353 RepID=UPI00379A94D2
MNDVGELLPLYRDDDRTRIRFAGGPGDGRTITWATGEPPFGVELPINQGLPTLAELDGPPGPVVRAAALYRPRLDGLGHPSRDDDGTLVYEYDGQ